MPDAMRKPGIALAADEIEKALARCAGARRRAIAMSHHANSAHIGSSLSSIEILDAIFSVSNVRPETAATLDRDRIVFSKGHAAMAYYATLEQHGLIEGAYLDTYLKPGTPLWGHVTLTPAVPAVDASSGSLGHGLSIAAGFALGHRLKGQDDLRTFCVLSDGECDEGSTWEAALFAGARRLDRLTAIIDYNHIQSLAPVALVLDLEPFADKWEAFGWDVTACDGHDWSALRAALRLEPSGRPHMIIADTVKGKGIPRIENTVASHYRPAQAGDLAMV